MVSNKERWNYLAVQRLSASLKRIKSKHDNYFYCLFLFIPLQQQKLESLKKVRKNTFL